MSVATISIVELYFTGVDIMTEASIRLHLAKDSAMAFVRTWTVPAQHAACEAHLEDALYLALHRLADADAFARSQQQSEADVVAPPPQEHAAPGSTSVRQDLRCPARPGHVQCRGTQRPSVMRHPSGTQSVSANAWVGSDCPRAAHPVAPLTKDSSVPIGASFSNPSTIARPSPTNITCTRAVAGTTPWTDGEGDAVWPPLGSVDGSQMWACFLLGWGCVCKGGGICYLADLHRCLNVAQRLQLIGFLNALLKNTHLSVPVSSIDARSEALTATMSVTPDWCVPATRLGVRGQAN